MLTGNRYLHALAPKPTWLFAPPNDGGDGADSGADGDGDDDDSDDDDGDDDNDGGDAEDDVDSLKADRDKWKSQSRKHEQRAKANAKAARELEDLRNKNLPADEAALREAEGRGRTAARAELAQQLAGARIEAALTGIVPDPSDIVEELNLAKFVDDDGEIDTDAIDDLKTKWAARMGNNSEDDDDANGGKPKRKADLKQGKRGKAGAGTPEQLTRDALKSMTPEQIEAARLAGQLNDVLGIKT